PAACSPDLGAVAPPSMGGPRRGAPAGGVEEGADPSTPHQRGGRLSVSQEPGGRQMGQRSRELTQVFGYSGWGVKEMFFEDVQGRRVVPLAGYDVPQDVRVVLRVGRRWTARCATCSALCGKVHEQLPARRWKDLPWAGRPVAIEYAPIRV